MEANLEELKMQVANLIARVSMAEAQIAEMDDDMPEQPSASIAEEAGSAPEQEYASYFKVYDASSGGYCKIGVRDGSTVSPMSNHCGGVWINGDYSATENAVTAALTEECTIFVWLLSRIVMDGVASSIGFTTTSNAPPPGGLVGSSRLLGRASIVPDGDGGYIVLAINQDYLSGGEHIAILYADCGLITVGN